MAQAYDQHATRLYKLAVYLSANASDAEDLLQETFIRVFSQVRRLKPDAGIGPYLDKTMINLARSKWRRSVREPAHSSPMGQADTGVSFEDRDELWHHLRRLPHRQKAVLFLKHYQGLSDGEIAERLDCSTASVRSLAHRALTKLRKDVSSDGS